MNKNLIKPIKPLHQSISWWQTITLYMVIGTILILGIITGWHYWRLQQLYAHTKHQTVPHEQQALHLKQTSEQLATVQAIEHKINHCCASSLTDFLGYCAQTLPPSMRLTALAMPTKKTFTVQVQLKNSQDFKRWFAELQHTQPERQWTMQTLEPDTMQGAVQCLKVILKGIA